MPASQASQALTVRLVATGLSAMYNSLLKKPLLKLARQ